MANNITFILPQWLLAKEPSMNCRSHKTILDMFAVYNIVSVVLSVILASPFFVNMWQKVRRVVFPWNWKCWKRRGTSEEEASSSGGVRSFVVSFVVSVLGSIALAVAAPLLAGNSIVKNHQTANRWVIIEQWSTRPRATIFVFVFNLIAATMVGHKGLLDDTQGFMNTAFSSLVSEIVLSLFGIKFLWNQTVVSLQKFDPSLPCTEPLTEVGNTPLNCPAMQRGAIALFSIIVINMIVVVLFFIYLLCTGFRSSSRCAGATLPALIFLLMLIMIFCIYAESWIMWSSFLHETSEDLYCVEGSAIVDLIYCLLPVVLGLWRLLGAVRIGK
ncbi:hypothetical protein F5882DRAFT_409841 [Hyaloscypha sp. PMI_1271]|nr:hypothetical protein F5882DRAFT_409841 [Hyaloscypha sp. PMI_1271]